MQTNTREANPGDVIHCGDRRLVVVENMPDGLSVIYYNDGLGPYYAVLPHASLYRRLYENENIGARESWWHYHPDMTGEYRVF